jgi:O-antigen ligase
MSDPRTEYLAPIPRPGRRSGARWAAIAGVAAVALAGSIAALAVASPQLAVVAVGLGVFAIGVIMRPSIATIVVVAVLYSNAAVIAVKFHDVPSFVAALVPAMLIPPLAAYLILERRPVIITSAFPWIVGLLLVQLLSGVISRDVPTAFDTIVTFLFEGIGLYFLLTNVIRSRETIIALVWVVVLIAGGLGALSFYQDATASYDNDYFGFAQPSEAIISTSDLGSGTTIDQVRLAGNIGEKNRYAQVLLVILPIGLFLAMAEKRTWRRLLALGATGFIAVGVALTFSRGAAVGFVLVAVIMTLLGYVKLRHIVPVVLAAALVLVAVPAYGERLASLVEVSTSVTDTGLADADGAVQSRVTEGLSALLAFADHPILGVGPGGFPGVYRHYAELVGIRVLASDREAHNLYFGMLAELGLIGFLVFATILWLTMRDLVRARKAAMRVDPMLAALCTGFLLSIVAYLSTGIFLHMSFIRYFWMILAMAGSVAIITVEVVARQAAEASAPPVPAIPAPPVGPEPASPRPARRRRAVRRARRVAAPGAASAQLPQSQSVQP